MPFLVTGLPRSRTAWLANALTTDHSFCRHEALLDGVTALVPWLSGASRRGDSDSGLPLVWPMVRNAFPEAPLVIVKRDPMQVRASAVKFLGDRFDVSKLLDVISSMESALKEIEVTELHLSVRFEDVGNVETGAKIWKYVLPDLPFDPVRWTFLNTLNVQQDLSKF